MIRFKALRFDSKKVIRRVSKTRRKVLSRFGAFVRQTAKRSIRKRKRTASPGNPPSSHTGLLRRFIWFGYDSAAQSVVIGPASLSQNGRGQAPENLEYGKRKYKARPFMGPAFEKEKPQLSKLWRNSVK